MDVQPHCTAKAALDKEKTTPLDSSDGKRSKCMSKFKEESVDNMEVLFHKQDKAAKSPEDVEVDIIGCMNNNNDIIRTVKTEDQEATEYSSSFADTMSDTEKCSALSDAEVESEYIGDPAFAYAFHSVFRMRKKRLTSHWRNFIRPLMWRCKWTELKMQEIKSQALKYARELSAYDQRKFSGIDQSTVESCGSKSLPFSGQCYRKKAMSRRRRKRIEETTDIKSYMSCHNLFSYLENKKTIPNGTYIADDFDNMANMDRRTNCYDEFGIDNDQLLLELRNGNDSLEQVLWKIEIVQSRVQKLRNQLDLVMSKNVSKLSSSENLSLLAACDVQTSSGPSPTFSAGNGETISVGPAYDTNQLISDYDVGDLVLPASAVSSYGEAFHVPDIIESTVGLLSSADVTCHQPQIRDLREDIVENVVLQNEGNDGEKQVLIRTNSQPMKQYHEPDKGEQVESTNPSRIQTSEPNRATKNMFSQELTTMLRSCLVSDICFPTSKRKRGERKASSSGWSRKHSGGEPDSQ